MPSPVQSSFPAPLAAPILQPLLQKPIPPSPIRAFPDPLAFPHHHEVRRRLEPESRMQSTYRELPPHRPDPPPSHKHLPHPSSNTSSSLRPVSSSKRVSPPPRLSPSPHAGDGGAFRRGLKRQRTPTPPDDFRRKYGGGTKYDLSLYSIYPFNSLEFDMVFFPRTSITRLAVFYYAHLLTPLYSQTR